MGSGFSSIRTDITMYYALGQEDRIIWRLKNEPDKSHYRMLLTGTIIFGKIEGTTLLSLSVARRYENLFNHLIDSGEDIGINYEGQIHGLTALDIACRLGLTSYAMRLIHRGATVHRLDDRLIYSDNLKMLLYMLLKRGYDINTIRTPHRMPNGSEESALSLAIKNGKSSLVEKLLKNGANPYLSLNMVTKKSFFKSERILSTPLEIAIIRKDIGVIECIMTASTITIPTEQQLTNIIKTAHSTNNKDVIRMIISKYYNVYCTPVQELLVSRLVDNTKGNPYDIIRNTMTSYEGCMCIHWENRKRICCKKTLIITIAILKRNKMFYDVYENILRYLV